MAERFDGLVDVRGFAFDDGADAPELALSELFRDLPVAVRRARFEGATQRPRKRVSV